MGYGYSFLIYELFFFICCLILMHGLCCIFKSLIDISACYTDMDPWKTSNYGVKANIRGKHSVGWACVSICAVCSPGQVQISVELNLGDTKLTLSVL